MERKVIKIFGAQDNIQAEMILETLGNNQIPAYKKGVGSSDIMNIYGGGCAEGNGSIGGDGADGGTLNMVTDTIHLLPET